ncbi:peroxin 11C [Coccidioides immitis RS]|uniref:Peroxin 11C n=2 Tax=Coccidioides immitis TaxID=5501 RepID=J3K2A0_COCIM|nr:peroxin 11C [Coccidioides immitis RS]EAS28199.3 peroxin 11C [Coccidioides immitis RS]KMU85828.1 25D9-5p [Coccidioides immitis H538.4]
MEDTVTTPDPLEPPVQAEPSPAANRTEEKAQWQPKGQKTCGCSTLKDTLSKADSTALRLSNLISTSYGEEATLAIAGYSADILHHALLSPPLRAIFSCLRTRLGLSASADDSKSQTRPLLALASLISETRTALRLLGLIPLWEWGSATVKSPPADPVLRSVAFAQVFVNVIYQFMENVAFLASKGVVSQRLLQRLGGVGKWYIWSTRAWLGHVVLEFVRLWRERSLAARQNELALAKASSPDDRLSDEDQRAEALRMRAWRKSLVNNLAWFPLCVHWSLEDGARVPSNIVGLLSFIATAWKVSDLWKATASAI